MRVSFVIPVRNDANRLARCLESIARADRSAAEVEVLVVDNASSDGSGDVARQHGATVIGVPAGRVSHLRNEAARHARGDVLAFVDADHEIGSGWIAAVVENLAVPGVAAAGALVHAPRPGTWVQRMYNAFRPHRSGRHDVEWLGSGNLAVRTSDFERAGGFDTSLETCEDVDLCQRLRRQGGRIVSDSRLHNVHYGDPETLRALFVGELWRGRDNIRASLRGPLTWRGLPSIVIPVLDLALFASMLVVPVALPRAGGVAAAVAASVALGLSALRAARMLRHLDSPSAADAPRAFAVAAVYDAARALAPVFSPAHRSTHRDAEA